MLSSQSWFDRNAGVVTFIALVVSVLAIGHAAISQRRRSRKTLDYTILRDEPIASGSSGTAPERLTVAWDGVALEKPRLIGLKIVNTGMLPIRSEDFDGPFRVRVSFGKIVTVEVQEHSMRTIPQITQLEDYASEPTLQFTQTMFDIAPILFNKGESITLLLVVDAVGNNGWPWEWGGSVKPEARIAGQTREMKSFGEPPPPVLKTPGALTVESFPKHSRPDHKLRTRIFRRPRRS